MDKKFRSSVSLLLWLPIFLFFALILILVGLKCAETHEWTAMFIVGGATLFILSTFFNTKYTVMYDGRLFIQCGFFRWTVQIQQVRKITRTKSLLSAPALSFDRLEVFYARYNSIVISPKDKAGFIAAILAVNPSVEVATEEDPYKWA